MGDDELVELVGGVDCLLGCSVVVDDDPSQLGGTVPVAVVDLSDSDGGWYCPRNDPC